MTKLLALELPVFLSREERATFTTSLLRGAFVIFFSVFGGLTNAPAQTVTPVFSFDGSDGAFPQGALVEGPPGKFYGTTPYGGTYDAGTVFEIGSDSKLTVLHSFDPAEGRMPYAGLVRARTGKFYGVTSSAGAGLYGTVFEITPTGHLTTLHSFCSEPNCTDGSTPYGGLVEGSNGNFYGTTYAGGANGHGTVFEVTPTGKLTTLYSFCAQAQCTDGAPFFASLIEGRPLNLYGTTATGGAYGAGTVFEITRKGRLRTLYSFCSQAHCADGSTPFAGLVQGRNGNFYGTTTEGGLNGTGGTIFEITSAGRFTTLYSFCSQPNCADGSNPYSGLVQGSDGNFYGTTHWLGAKENGGTVFEITPGGKLRTLYSFCAQPGCVDGLSPVAELIQGSTGKFYGSTFEGGIYGANDCGGYGDFGCGILFRLELEPPVRRSIPEEDQPPGLSPM